MNFKAIFNEFKSQVAFTLLLVWLLAIWRFQTLNSILHPLLAVGLMMAIDLGWTYLRSKKLYWPSASVVTGFLIGLIIAPTEPLWIIAVATMAAFVSKQFIGTGIRQHIFNPAAFGIMAVNIAFAVPVAWWAVAWGQLPIVILIPAMARILWRMRRIWLPITFLLVYITYYLPIFFPTAIPRLILDGTLMLFALVMLTEPTTSPVVGKSKYVFGAAVAVIVIVLSQTGILSEVFLPALLIGNLGAFLIKRLRSKPKTQSTNTGQSNPQTQN